MRWASCSASRASQALFPWFKTPHLDRLAAEGARFANVFVTTSLCSPSRASLLSGQYAHRHKVLNNFTDYPHELPGYPRRSARRRLRDGLHRQVAHGRGRRPAAAGLRLLDEPQGPGQLLGQRVQHQRPSPRAQGLLHDGRHRRGRRLAARQAHRARGCWCSATRRRTAGRSCPQPKYEHAFDDQKIARPANADSYRAADGKPAWLEKSYPTWHGLGGPLYGQKEYGKFVRAYLGCIASVDDSVGPLYRDPAASHGQLDNTMLIFTSDNGFALGEHGRTDKRTAYEESLRVPLLVRYPPLVKAGHGRPRDGAHARPGAEHPRHLRAPTRCRPPTACPGSRCWQATPPDWRHVVLLPVQLRGAVPLHAQRPCDAHATTGSTSTTRTATAARTATRPNCTT